MKKIKLIASFSTLAITATSVPAIATSCSKVINIKIKGDQEVEVGGDINWTVKLFNGDQQLKLSKLKAKSSKTKTAKVIVWSPDRDYLTIRGLETGKATITITATAEDGSSGTKDFDVEVKEKGEALVINAPDSTATAPANSFNTQTKTWTVKKTQLDGFNEAVLKFKMPDGEPIPETLGSRWSATFNDKKMTITTSLKSMLYPGEVMFMVDVMGEDNSLWVTIDPTGTAGQYPSKLDTGEVVITYTSATGKTATYTFNIVEGTE